MIDLEDRVAGLLRRAGVGFERLSLIVLNRSQGRYAALAVLVFLDEQPTPFAAIKVSADPARASSLRCECENLQRLHERGSIAFRRSIPAPLRLEQQGELLLLAETAIPGQRLKDLPPDRYFRSERFERHLTQVVDWLVEFHRASPPASGGEPDPADAVEAYRRHHARSAGLDELLSETVAVLRGHPSARTLAWHGDFSTANVIARADESLGVLDWEYPLRHGWPLADLLYFFASVWCTPYAKGRAARLENYRTLYFGTHRLTGTIRRAAAAYLERVGVVAQLALPFSVIAWVSYANRKQAVSGAAPPGGGPEHEPLIIIDDGRCVNLELLAARRGDYLLTRTEPA